MSIHLTYIFVLWSADLLAIASLEKFFQEATSNDFFEQNKSIAEGLKKLGLPDLHTAFPGMVIRLLPHQVIGVCWLIEKEKGYNKGGLLCDEMGLGKTVQMSVFSSLRFLTVN